MTLPMAAWRVTYTPGHWLVLSGPTMLVVMLPAPARASKLVNDLWAGIVAADCVDALMRLVAEVGLDAMPDLGAFFWDAEGLHGLTRGGVRIVDTQTGEVALEGKGTLTWREENLGGQRHLRIDLEPVDDDEVLQLPLVVGAAAASAIYLTTDPEALVRFPTYEQLGVLPKLPVLGVRPRNRQAEPVIDMEAGGASGAVDDVTDSDGPVIPDSDGPVIPDSDAPQIPAADLPVAVEEPASAALAPEPPSDADPAASEAPGEEPPNPADEEPSGEPVGSDEPLIGGFIGEEPDPGHFLDDSTDPGAIAAPPVPPITPPVVPAPGLPEPQRSAPVVVPPRLGEFGDDEGGTIFSTGLAATHKPAPQPEQRQDPQVLAVPCANGHANAPGSRACRICKAPVDSSNPRLIRRPLLAGVHTNQGDFLDIATGVVIGRAPDAGKGPAGSEPLRVPSPSSDISRNHLLVTTRDWNVHVTDLHSTNGTTVLPVGEPPFTLRDGASVQVELGTVLDLGDGVSLRIEPPRG